MHTYSAFGSRMLKYRTSALGFRDWDRQAITGYRDPEQISI